MVWWMALALAAEPANYTVDDLRQTIEEAAPLVERAAGRRLESVPEAGIEPVSYVEARWVARGVDAAELRPDLAHALAAYIFSERRIVLLKDNIERQLQTGALAPEHLASMVFCTVAHELTHALQHQYEVPRAPETRMPALYLSEGHATLVEHQICVDRVGPAIARHSARLSGSTAIAGQSVALPQSAYNHGMVYVADLQEREGREGLWRALASPPSLAVLRKAADDLTEPAWRAEAVLTTVMPHFDGWQVEISAADPLPDLQLLFESERPPEVRACAELLARRDDRQFQLNVMALASAEEAEAWFLRRRRLTRQAASGGKTLAVLFDHDMFRSVDTTARYKVREADQVAGLANGPDRGEVVFRQGAALVVASVMGMSPKEVREVLEPLSAYLRAHPAADLRDLGPLLAHQPVEPPATNVEPTPLYVMTMAERDRRVGRYSDCIKRVRPYWGEVADSLRLGLICAQDDEAVQRQLLEAWNRLSLASATEVAQGLEAALRTRLLDVAASLKVKRDSPAVQGTCAVTSHPLCG